MLLLPAAGAITSCLKITVRRPRPNMYHMCWTDGQPVWRGGSERYRGTSDSSGGGSVGDHASAAGREHSAAAKGGGGYPLCNADARHAKEGFKSFPSGHASWSTSGAGRRALQLQLLP